MTLKPFKYQTLESDHIRLARLHRRSEDELISIDVFHVRYEHAPDYEALSYRWDEESPKQTIMAEGLVMEVMQPVYDFLLWRSSSTQTALLWIDSICIDQSPEMGDLEKESQIPLMGKIFSQAVEVSIWLGHIAKATEVWGLIDAVIQGKHQNFVITNSNATDRGDQSAWASLATLLGSPWFNRMWVVQEVVFARRLFFIFGGIKLPWQTLEDFLSKWNPLDMAIRLPTAKPQADAMRRGLLAVIQLTRLRIQSSEDLRMIEALELCTTMQATKVHDKIYAMLGLFKASSDIDPILPHYTIPVSEVFRRAMVHTLRSSRPLLLLVIAGVGWARNIASASWVPDFSQQSRRPIGHDHRSDYTAGLSIPAHVEFENVDTSTIKVRGNKIDTIVRVGEINIDVADVLAQSEMETINMYRAFMDDLDQLAMSLNLNPESSSEETVWKTVLQYHATHRFPNPVEAAASYLAFRWFLRLDISADDEDPNIVGVDESQQADPEFGSKLQRALGFVNFLSEAGETHRVAVTNSGRLAMVPPLTKVEDQICVIYGTTMPYLLRPAGRDDATRNSDYELVGYTYIFDYMWGDYANETKAEMFTLV